jgi:hypothetical protein
LRQNNISPGETGPLNGAVADAGRGGGPICGIGRQSLIFDVFLLGGDAGTQDPAQTGRGPGSKLKHGRPESNQIRYQFQNDGLKY